MDRLNLENLTLTSRAICAAADFRRDSRGAHFREDFPQASELAASAYTSVRLAGEPPAGDERARRFHPRAAGAKPAAARRRRVNPPAALGGCINKLYCNLVIIHTMNVR